MTIVPCTQAETYNELVERVGKYFDPPPGTIIKINPNDYKNREKKENYFSFSKTLIVNPPKGKCFYIRQRAKSAELQICKKKTLEIKISDLFPDGRIEIDFMDTKDPFFRKLYWYTPHRVGKFIDVNMPWPGTSRLIWIRDCTYRGSTGGFRDYKIDFFNMKSFSFRVPAKDIKIPKPKIKRMNNLSAIAKGAKESVAGKDEPTGENPDNKSEVVEVNVEEGEEEGEEAVEQGAEGEVAEEKKEKEAPRGIVVADEDVKMEFKSSRRSLGDSPMAESFKGRTKDPRRLWNISWKVAYFTEGANIFAGNDATPGSKGHCRYSYSGYRMDKSSPALECKQVGRYQWFYIPVTCLSPKHANP